MKRFAIIVDEIHPLIEVMQQRVRSRGNDCVFVHWTELVSDDSGIGALNGFDQIYLDRLGEGARSYATQIQLLGLNPELRHKIFNAPQGYWWARDKALSHAVFRTHGIPTPATWVLYSIEQVSDNIGNNGRPWVLKSTLGCCAEEVQAFSGTDIPECFARDILARDGQIILQEFLRPSGGHIWRIDVVGGEVVVANRRFAFNENDELPLCNGTRGGRIEFVDPSKLPREVSQLVERVMVSFELEVAGVDLLVCAQRGLQVIEVNPEPDITLNRYEFPYAIADYLMTRGHSNRHAQKELTHAYQ